jgi:hypothetical protein
MRIRLLFLISAGIMFIFSGCVGTHQQIIKLESPFDVNEAKKIFDEGNNKIVGSALIRQRGGGIVTCAGCDVLLYPATDYAKERFKLIYGNIDKRFINFDNKPLVKQKVYNRRYESGTEYSIPVYVFEPDHEEYHQFRRQTIGDSQGFFEFDKLQDGEYFILTTIKWQVLDYATEGGTLMQRVEVKGGESKKVVLAP